MSEGSICGAIYLLGDREVTCVRTHGHPDVHLALYTRNGRTDHFTWGGESAVLHTDEINYPKHYNSHPSGIECITIAEHHNFNIGNVFKYIWRAGLKDVERVNAAGRDEKALQDLRKAQWYLQREIARLEKP